MLILNLTENAPTEVIWPVFIQADNTSNVAQLKDPCSSFFLYFCLQQEQAVENILQHYAPVLKFSINDFAWIAILFLYVTFCTVQYLDRCAFGFPPCKFMFEITLNRIAYFSLLHWAFDENDQKIELHIDSFKKWSFMKYLSQFAWGDPKLSKDFRPTFELSWELYRTFT